MRYRSLFALGFVAVFLALSLSCASPPPKPPAAADTAAPKPPELLTASLAAMAAPSVSVHATATTLWVLAYFASGALADTAGFNSGGTRQGHTLPAGAVKDSFGFPLPAVATSGYLCLFGSPGTASACGSWSYAPPPPTVTPKLDSIRVKSISFTVAAGQPRQLCVYGFLDDGSIRSGGMVGAAVPAQCDSIGRALWNVRYSMRRLSPFKLALR